MNPFAITQIPVWHRDFFWYGPLLLGSLLIAACVPTEPPRINLYRAIHAGDLDQIKRHLHAGADLNQVDSEGQMPLHVAAARGSQVVCELLLDHGAQLEARNRAGYTPLQQAVLMGKIPVAQLLLQRGAHLEAQALLYTVIRNEVEFREVYEFLVKQGAQVNALNTGGESPLIMAIRQHNRVIVKRLIELGAQVSQATALGMTPLAIARQINDTTIARLLLQHGAIADP